MARLTVARPGGEHFEASFAKTVRAAVEQALAEGAVVVCITYETPAGFRHIAVPSSRTVAVGLHEQLTETLFPAREIFDE